MYICELCGNEVCREFFGEPNSSPHEVSRSQTTRVSAAASFLNEATIDSVLLAAIEQFEDQATNRLLIAALEKYEDLGTTQKKEDKTPAKMPSSTLSKHCM